MGLFQTTLAFFPPLFKLFHEKTKGNHAMAITGYSVDAYADAFGKWSTYVNGIKDMYFRIFKNKAEINGKRTKSKSVHS